MSDINEINLNAERLDTVRVGIVQFKFENEFFKEDDGLIFAHDFLLREKYDLFLKCAKDRDVNILCFPELSSSSALLNELRDFADENGIIIIAGSYYNSERKNVCPILIPDCETYFTEKINISPFEQSPYIDQRPVNGENIFVIIDSIFGSFAVVICADFLDDEIKTQLFKRNIDFLFVISLNRQSEDWHIDMNRDCTKNKDGIYIIYSNSIFETFGDGHSAIFGLMDKIHLDGELHSSIKYKFMEITDENMLVADFDIRNKKATVPRTIKNVPNIIPIHPYNTKSQKELLSFFNIIGLQGKRYQKITDLFVPPRNFSEIYNKLKDDKIVFIVGDPEIGKTYTSVKLLLDSYRNDGYYPDYYKGHDLGKQIEAMTEKLDSVIKDKSVVYFEDPWGKTELKDSGFVFKDIDELIDRISDVDARVIITSRLNIFKLIEAKKESLKDLWEHVKRLSIKLAYTEEDLNEMLKNYLKIFKPKWHNNIRIINMVTSAIQNNILRTPMSIRKLVESHDAKNTEDESIIFEAIQDASKETNIAFGKEIEAIFDSGEYEKIVFLSFPYIYPFEVEFIQMAYDNFLRFLNRNYNFDLIKAKKFSYHIDWFIEEIDIYSEMDKTLLDFSHSSYSDGFTAALKNNQELYEKIFHNLLIEISEYNSEIRSNLGNFIFENFDMFPKTPCDILYKLLSDENSEVKLLVGEIIFENFEKFSEIPFVLINKMSVDKDVEVRISAGEIVAENFDVFPEFAEDFITKMFDDVDSSVRNLVGEIIFENFEKFSEIPFVLINKMSVDKDVEVRISAGEIVAKNFDVFPEFAEKILTKLSEDKNMDVRTSIGHEITENFDVFPRLAKKLILKFSKDLNWSIKKLSGEIVSSKFKFWPDFAKDVLTRLVNDDDVKVRNSVGIIIAENFEVLSGFAEDLIVKLSDDVNPKVRILIAEIIFENLEEFSILPNDLIYKLSEDQDFRVRILVGRIIAYKLDNFFEIPYDIINHLSVDDNPKVRISVGDIVAKNFEVFPEFAEGLIIKLTEDNDVYVKKEVVNKFAKILGKTPYLAEKYIKKLSSYEDEDIQTLIINIFRMLYYQDDICAKNLLRAISKDEDDDIRLSACEVINSNYDLFPELATELLYELSADQDSNVKFLANDILNKDIFGGPDYEEEFEETNIHYVEWDRDGEWNKE